MPVSTLKIMGLAVIVAIAANITRPQPADWQPPRLIQIRREQLSFGRSEAFLQAETEYARVMAGTNRVSHYAALVSVSGPSEVWFVTPYESYAEWSKSLKDQEPNTKLAPGPDHDGSRNSELLTGLGSVVATYREDLSYRPGVMGSHVHCFSVATVRTRPGRTADYVAERRIVKAAHEKAAIKEDYFVYQVASGLPAGTFFVVIPYADLGELDSVSPTHGKAYDDALGDDGRKKSQDLTTSGILDSDTMIFLVHPEMSHIAYEWIAADPDFWNKGSIPKSPRRH